MKSEEDEAPEDIVMMEEDQNDDEIKRDGERRQYRKERILK